MDLRHESDKDLQSKKLIQILDELEIYRNEIINLKERLEHLEKNREIKNYKFRHIDDLIIWTDETTNKKELFHIPEDFDINNINNISIDNDGLLLIYWGDKRKNKLKVSEELYCFLKEITPRSKVTISNLPEIFKKLNCEKTITDEMLRVWDVLVNYKDVILKTRVIYLKAKVVKQTALNHLNLFKELGLVNKLSGGRWQLNNIKLDRFRHLRL